MGLTASSDFEIVVMSPIWHQDLDLSGELRQVKAALLYADSVTLNSPTVASLNVGEWFLDRTIPEEGLNAVLKYDEPLSNDPVLMAAAHVYQYRRVNGRQRSLASLERAIAREPSPSQLRTASSDVSELLSARDAGVLRLEVSQIGYRAYPDLATPLAMETTRALGSSSTSYPMFDIRIAGGLKHFGSLLRRRGLKASSATEVHLAAAFIGRMQTFPDAKMDEVLDVRRELAGPLTRFRSAVSGIAREMDETPIDAEFARAADARYRESVAPALLEIRELQQERGYFRQLLRQATIGEARPDVGATIGLAAVTYAALPALGAAVAGMTGPALSAAVNLATAVARERARLGRELGANKFIFLTEAERRFR
jgi:hypothetical protein